MGGEAVAAGLGCQDILVPLGNDFEILHGFGAFEDTGERIIISGGDGIELMVVAAGAADGEPVERAHGGVELLVDDVHFHFLGVVFGEHLGTEGEEAGGGPALVHGV